jgi:hypothetical protein
VTLRQSKLTSLLLLRQACGDLSERERKRERERGGGRRKGRRQGERGREVREVEDKRI